MCLVLYTIGYALPLAVFKF